MGKPRAPRAPDPIATGAAQTGTNVSTAIANQIGSLINQNTPYGSLTYDQTGTYSFTDPNSGRTYELPRFTANQTLTPQGQTIQDNTLQAQINMSGTAANATGRLQQLMGQGINTSNLPGRGQVPTLQGAPSGNYAAQGNIANAGAIQRQVGNAGPITQNISNAGPIQRQVEIGPNSQKYIADAGAITRTYNTDFSQDRQRVEQALMSRLNPSLQQDRSAREAQLRQQGIVLGSAAYDRAMGQLDQQSNDARMQAVLAGGQEQSRMVGLERDRAMFQNAAQQQQFGQNYTGAQFYNQGLSQDFDRRLAAGQFANAAQGQQFGQNATQAQFQNSAQAQQFGQNLQAGQFANSAQQQQFGQNAAQTQQFNAAQGQNWNQALAGAGFNNQTAQTQYQMQNSARQQALQEQMNLRNQQLNEIQALMGGSQVQSPNFVNTPGLNMPTTDYAGLIQQNFANQNANYQQQMGAWNGLWGGLMGGAASLGTGWLMGR